ncbi:MAG: DUF5916 domain-containing protein [Luteibaculaceae bacterium]
MFVAYVALTHTLSFAQVSLPNKLEATFIEERIILDGYLDEDVWLNANKISNFTQRELNLGEPVTERTEVAILYDNNNLYIGVWCYDSEPNKLIAKELKRDFNYNLDDNFIIVIDTYNDLRNGFMFVTNPVAARADLQVFNNGGSVNSFWNGVWDVKTKVTDEGWFAEFEIPFYTLKYRTGIIEQIWGINFERNIRRKREQAMWQGWSRDNRIEQVNRAGKLVGLNNVTDAQFVEIKPYAIGGGEFNPNAADRGVLNGGGDVNYLITPTYRLNLTFNTDFAQVEADQQQVNITRFPLFFPELREFFLEGDDFFNMGFGGNRIIPFYTRRIGLNENAEQVPIIAGGRLLGKEQDRTVGLMSIQTASYDGNSAQNFTVGSWRQDVGAQSVVGAMTVNKFEAGRWHTTTGLNGRFSTAKFLGNKNLDLGGAFIKTHATDIGWEDNSFAYRAFVSYPNDKFSVFASTQRAPAEFEPEVGLMLRRSFRESYANVAYRPRPINRAKWIRQFDFRPFDLTYTQYDDTREIQSFYQRFRYLGFETRSGERIDFNYSIVAEGIRNDFRIAPEIIIPVGTYWWQQHEAFFSTFRGRLFSMSSSATIGEFYDGNAFINRTDVLWRTSKYFNMSLRYEKNIINLPGGSFETDLVGSRMEYAFSPNAFGSVLSQWNSAQDEFNFNLRLHVIPKIGTDFFLIVNQIYDSQTGKLVRDRGTILGKLVWRFVV